MFQRHKLLYLYSIKELVRLYLDENFPNRFTEKNCKKARSFLSFVNEKLSIQSGKNLTALFLLNKSKHIRVLSRMLFYFNTTGKNPYSTLNIHSI